MTLEEKVGQLNLVFNGPEMDWDGLRKGTIGAVINFNNAQDIAQAQKLAKESRLGIPLLFGLDVVHGFRTQFPVPLGEAATFDPELARQAARAMAEEARYIGVNWTFAPMSDLSRDIRWGRIVEGFGEDPYLGSVLTAARVEGIQQGGLIATAKHFVGYGAPVGGRDYATTLIPTSELHDIYLPPFHAAVTAGAGSIMSAFNALNGVPSTINRPLLTGVLRDKWGFEGFVTSDWAGILELLAHGVAADEMEAAVKALEAGVDMDMVSGIYHRNLAKAVQSGRLAESVLDEAVRRVLRAKLKAGLFDAPPQDADRLDDDFPTTETRKLARELAVRSYVLLKNDDGFLPVRDTVKSVSVIGPLADQPCEQLGPHAARGQCEDAVSYLSGIRERAEKSGIGVRYEPGCDLSCKDEAGFEKAREAASASDLVFLVLGEQRDASGEAASKVYLDLPGRQGQLLDSILDTGKPVVLVLMSGRPLDIRLYNDRLSAVLMTWYPGTEGGHALADILFGDRNPSGKLPVSYPRSVGQLPLYYNDLPSGRPYFANNRFTLGYVDESHLPLYPFGWGVGYSAFSYSDIEVSKNRITIGDDVEITVTVRNDGSRVGDETVQLYVRDPVASRSRPFRELKAFARVSLQGGESRRITLKVSSRQLGFHLEDGTYTIEPGRFDIWVGGNSLATLETSIELE